MGCGVRHWQLLLGLLVLTSLFSSICLIHLTSVHSPYVPSLVRPFASLASAHPHDDWRFKREISSFPSNTSAKWDEGHPVVNDEEGKAPIPVVPPTTPRPPLTKLTTFVFSNPPSTPSTTTTTTTTTEAPTTPPAPTEEEPNEEEKVEKEEKEERKDDTIPGILDGNKAKPIEESHWNLDTVLRMLYFSCAGIGMLLGLVILPLLVKIPPAYLAAGALIVSSGVTAWQPFMNFYGSAVARIVQGLSFTFSLPLVQSLVVEWSPIKDRAFFLSFILQFFPLSIMIFWPITQLISDQDLPRWSPHIVLSVFSFILSPLVAFLFKRHPHDHNRISGEELNIIRAGKSKEEAQVRRAISNIRSTSFWAVFSSSLAFFLALSIIALYLPSILASSEIMYSFNLGVTSALPFIGFAVIFFICSIPPSTSISTRILNSAGLVLTAVFLVLLPILVDFESNQWFLPSILLPLGVFSAGAIQLGVIHSSIRTIPAVFIPLALAMTITPVFTTIAVHKNTRPEWVHLLLPFACLICILGAPFAFFARQVNFPSTKQRSLKLIREEDECGLTEMQLLPPAGKHLT